MNSHLVPIGTRMVQDLLCYGILLIERDDRHTPVAIRDLSRALHRVLLAYYTGRGEPVRSAVVQVDPLMLCITLED